MQSRINATATEFCAKEQSEVPLGGNGLRIGKENIFDHNILYHIYNNTPDTINATKNYWYPQEPESIACFIYDYYDDPNLGVVIYEPAANKIAGGPQGSELGLAIMKIDWGPNPAQKLSISYTLYNPQEIEISVYDVCGRLISKDIGIKAKGKHNFVVNEISDGVYFIKFKSSGFEVRKKAILLK